MQQFNKPSTPIKYKLNQLIEYIIKEFVHFRNSIIVNLYTRNRIYEKKYENISSLTRKSDNNQNAVSTSEKYKILKKFLCNQQQKTINISQLSMDLIDFSYNIMINKVPQPESFKRPTFSNVFTQNLVKQTVEQFETISFSSLIKKIQGRSLIGNIIFRKSHLLIIRSRLFSNNLLKSITHQQKLTLLKYFLILNRSFENICFKLNFQTGDISLQILLNLPDHLRIFIISIIEQFLLNILSCLTEYAEKSWGDLLYLINQKILNPEESYIRIKQQIQSAKKMKSYCHSSSYYAWNIIQGHTKSLKNDLNTYQEKKSKFRRMRTSITTNNKIQSLSKCLNLDGPRKLPFFNLKVDEDQQVKQKYLSGTNLIIKNNRILNQIELSSNQVKEIKQRSKVSVQLSTGQKQNLIVRKDKSNQQILHQKQILKKLPNFEYYGLPVYYTIKNQKQNLDNIILTNLSNIRSFKKYIQINKKTLSMTTKMFIFSQVANSLIYLRNNQVLYHNLTPNSIKLKKGLKVKLTDLSNAMHQELKFQQVDELVDLFPYVQNFKNIDDSYRYDERSDSYSFGVLIFETLFNKTPLNLRDSKSKFLSQEQKIRLSCQQIPITNQFLNNFGFLEMKPLYNFIQKAIHCESVNKEWQQLQEFCIRMKGRPYLDWFAIVCKYLMNNI